MGVETMTMTKGTEDKSKLIREAQNNMLIEAGYNKQQASRVRGYVDSVSQKTRSGKKYRTDIMFNWLSRNVDSVLGWSSKEYVKALLRTLRESTPSTYRDVADGFGLNLRNLSHENALYVVEGISRIYFTHLEDIENARKLADVRALNRKRRKAAEDRKAKADALRKKEQELKEQETVIRRKRAGILKELDRLSAKRPDAPHRSRKRKPAGRKTIVPAEVAVEQLSESLCRK